MDHPVIVLQKNIWVLLSQYQGIIRIIFLSPHQIVIVDIDNWFGKTFLMKTFTKIEVLKRCASGNTATISLYYIHFIGTCGKRSAVMEFRSSCTNRIRKCIHLLKIHHQAINAIIILIVPIPL